MNKIRYLLLAGCLLVLCGCRGIQQKEMEKPPVSTAAEEESEDEGQWETEEEEREEGPSSLVIDGREYLSGTGTYTGFPDDMYELTKEELKEMGYVVHQSRCLLSGEEVLREFFRDVSRRSPSILHLAELFTGVGSKEPYSVYFTDILYDGNCFYAVTDEDMTVKGGFTYIRKLEGSMPNARAGYTYYILTNIDNLGYLQYVYEVDHRANEHYEDNCTCFLIEYVP